MKQFPLYKQYDAMDCGPTCGWSQSTTAEVIR